MGIGLSLANETVRHPAWRKHRRPKHTGRKHRIHGLAACRGAINKRSPAKGCVRLLVDYSERYNWPHAALMSVPNCARIVWLIPFDFRIRTKSRIRSESDCR